MLRWFRCTQEGDIPSARDSHSATVVANQIYIFGGQDIDENQQNDFFRAQIRQEMIMNDQVYTLTWQRISLKRK